VRNEIEALLRVVADVLSCIPSPRQRNELRDAAFAVRAELAGESAGLSDWELMAIARKAESDARLGVGDPMEPTIGILVTPAGLRAVARAARGEKP